MNSKKLCKVIFILSIFFILIGCSDLFNDDFTSDLSFKINIPNNRSIENTNAELVVNLISKNGDISKTEKRFVTFGESTNVSFKDINIGAYIKISANISVEDKLLYTGETDWVEVKPSDTKISLILEKIQEIIDAAAPEIVTDVEDKLYTPSTPPTNDGHTLTVSAISPDNGIISFQWQQKNADGNWIDIEETNTEQAENIYASICNISLSLGDSNQYRCVITNTNESVNGEKTATIYSREATISYLEGTLTEITATYTGEYELLDSEFYENDKYNYSKVLISETYTFVDNTTAIYEKTATEDEYSIEKTNPDDIETVGYVPFTVTSTENENLTAEMRVPIKYQLSEENISVHFDLEKIPHLTGKGTLSPDFIIPAASVYKSLTSESSDNYDVISDVDISWSKGTKNTDSSVSIDNSTVGDFTYTVTATPKDDSWCIGSVSASHEITVSPWEIAISQSGNTNIDKTDLIGGTSYTLSATNEAEENPSVTWTSSNTYFELYATSTLTTPVGSTEGDKTATISAKVDGITIGSIDVTVKKLINAAAPEIVMDVEDKIYTSITSTDSIEHTLTISANSPDNGILSFQWQQKSPDGNWIDIEETNTEQAENLYTSICNISLSLGDSNQYRCVITNTNESVNGEKTATIYSREATISYLEGTLTEITATYTGEYETLGLEFNKEGTTDYSNVTISEIYSFSNGETKSCEITATEDFYTIARPEESDPWTIGYVPFTITSTENENLTAEMRVPVKYQLDEYYFAICGENYTLPPETIAQKTGEETLSAYFQNIPEIYETPTSTTAVEYNYINDVTLSWKKEDIYASPVPVATNTDGSVTIDNSTDGMFYYTVTATPKDDSWCIGDSVTTYHHTVTICPWKIAIKDGKGIDDLTSIKDNLEGFTTYTLFATNDAVENPNVTWTSNNEAFAINADLQQLSTPNATYSDQTATITAKVGEIEVGTIDITVKAVGTIDNPITDWNDLVTAMNVDGGDIYISGDMIANSTLSVNYPRKIIAANPVTITRDSSFTGAFFNNTSTLTLGDGTNTITLDGGKINNINAQAPLIQSGAEGASLTLNNCKLQNNKNVSTTVKGGAISISGGTFTMDGGVIGTETTEEDESKQSWEYVADAENFSNYAAAGGGGIYVADGTVEIKNAKVSYNSVPDNDSYDNPNNTPLKSGGGILMEKGNLTLENTEVSYNRGYQGGGVRCYNDGTENVGTLTLKNATIKGNAGTHYAWSNFGGALAIRNFEVICDKLADASIIEENYSADGGAVFLEGTTSTLENITIQNNSFNENGYRNGSEMLLYSPATISIGSSDVTIKSSNENEDRGIYLPKATNINLNLFGDVKLDTPIYLALGETITIGELTADKVAKITPQYYPGETYESDSQTITVGEVQVITGDDNVTLSNEVSKFDVTPKVNAENGTTNYTIDSDGKIAEISSGEDETIKSVSDLSSYFDSTEEYYALTTGTYTFESDITLDYPIRVLSNYSVTLLSNTDVTITSSFENSNLIYVDRTNNEDCGKLTLGGGDGTLTLKHVNQHYSTIASYGDLTLANNCAITESQYCAVQIYDGNFIMNGGAIYNNTYTGTNTQSAAITLLFSDDSIESCSAEFYGGEIYNNTSTSGGGLAYIGTSYPYITLSNVSLYNNQANDYGGGIYSGTANLYIYTSSKIYNNFVNDIDCGASIYVTMDAGYFYLDGDPVDEIPYNYNIGT